MECEARDAIRFRFFAYVLIEAIALVDCDRNRFGGRLLKRGAAIGEPAEFERGLRQAR